MESSIKTKQVINAILEKEFGITYEDYIHLDIYKQQEIIKILRAKKPKKNDNRELVMVGYGEYSFVTKVERGTKVMTRYGEVVEAGLTPEEAKERFTKKEEELIEDKPKKKFLGIFRRKV